MMGKRKLFIVVSVICGALLLVSAGQKSGGQSGKKDAKQDSAVVIYSPQGEDDVQYILDAAEKALDFKVEILRIDGGLLADRLLAEKANPQADVVLGITQLSIAQLKQEGVLQPFEPSWAAKLPAAFQDPQHYFYSFWQTPIVIAYNADFMTAAQAPKSWLDLVKPQYKGKFTIGQTAWQTTRAYLVGMLWRFYDPAAGDVKPEAWDFMRKLYANAVPYPGDELNNKIAAGEIPIVLHWFGGTVKAAEQYNINFQYVNTEGGTPMVAESLGLIAGRNNTEKAKAFIDWFGSADFQASLAKDLGKAPALPEAMSQAPEETRKNISFFTAQDIDWGAVVKNLDQWLSKIELEIIP